MLVHCNVYTCITVKCYLIHTIWYWLNIHTTTLFILAGAGIYVLTSHSHGGEQPAQPNNTYIRAYYRNSYTRFALYCCSNSSLSYVGSITDRDNRVRTSNFYSNRITRYNSEDRYAGCIYMYAYISSWRSWYPYEGVYTCNIPDNNGIDHHVGFALYSERKSKFRGSSMYMLLLF